MNETPRTSMMIPPGKTLIAPGTGIALVGAEMLFSDRIPFPGRVPADISVKKGSFQLFSPLATSVLISPVLSAILRLISSMTRK